MPNSVSKGPNPTATIKSFSAPEVELIWDEIVNLNNLYPNLESPVIFPTTTNTTTSVFIPGNLQVNGTIYGTVQPIPSDIRIKNNLDTISLSLANNILKLEAKEFTYIADTHKTTHYGFIAQEFEEYFPKLVSKTYIPQYKEPVKAINYTELIPLLVKKIQDLQSQIDEMRNAL